MRRLSKHHPDYSRQEQADSKNSPTVSQTSRTALAYGSAGFFPAACLLQSSAHHVPGLNAFVPGCFRQPTPPRTVPSLLWRVGTRSRRRSFLWATGSMTTGICPKSMRNAGTTLYGRASILHLNPNLFIINRLHSELSDSASTCGQNLIFAFQSKPQLSNQSCFFCFP